MKKYIFIALTALCVTNAIAQKLEKPRIDKITGDTTFEVKEEVLANPFTMVRHYLGSGILKGKGYYVLYFHLKEGGDAPYYVLQGTKATIKFTDGKLIQITAVADEYSAYKPVVTESTISYHLTDSDIDALISGKISVVRVQTSVGAVDFEIKENKTDMIKKQLELISKK